MWQLRQRFLASIPSRIPGRGEGPWHKPHTTRFERKNAAQGSDTVFKFYETKFMVPAQKERIADNWPVDLEEWKNFTNLHDAHTFFANLDPHIKASLLHDTPATVDPGRMDRWVIANIYAEARKIGSSPSFAAEQAQRL